MANLPKPARARKSVVKTIAALLPPPNWIAPCVPTLVDRPPTGPNWRHEVKWDGSRICVVIDDGKAAAGTRRGHDWTY
jgi:bifunctional non-homologous end joining protein LigD